MSILIDKSAKVIVQGMTGVLALVHAVPAAADNGAEYPSAVSTFDNICLVKSIDPADRIKALENSPYWTEDEKATVDVPAMAISRTISKNYSFKKVDSQRQWSGEIDGARAKIVVASFEGKVRYRNLCALVMSRVNNAMPYGRELRQAFKNFGIGGKSVDLVHYYEFAGKLKPGEYPVEKKHPVRGEIFSRSESYGFRAMHIYVAY